MILRKTMLTHFAKIEHDLVSLGYPALASAADSPDLELWAKATWQYGTDLFSDAHARYQASHKAWAKACDEREKICSGKNTPQAKKDDAIRAALEAKKPRDADFNELLRARAGEELCRVAPGLYSAYAMNDEDLMASYLRWATGFDKWAWAVFA